MTQASRTGPVTVEVKQNHVTLDLAVTGMDIPISQLTWGQLSRAGWGKFRSTQWIRFSTFRTRFPSRDQTWKYFSGLLWGKFYSLTWGRF